MDDSFNIEDIVSRLILSKEEELAFQQFKIRDYLTSKSVFKPEEREYDRYEYQEVLPDRWILTNGIELYEWQKEALDRWIKEGKKGTFKIVTGGGKTFLALAAIEWLQNNEVRDLKVVIIVPTIVLMEQWYSEILERGNIPKKFIGKLGGGYQDNFEDGKVVLICVLNSASKKLTRMVHDLGIGSKLFLIVDECHRAGAKEMSKIFETKRAFNMGLSATPERDDEIDEDNYLINYQDSLLGKNLGDVIMELTYEDALKKGLIPPFIIKHFGIYLNDKEQYEYDNLTRIIIDSKSKLQNFSDKYHSNNALFYRWAQKIAQQDKGDISSLARSYVASIAKRKSLLYKIENRKRAVVQLIDNELGVNPDAKILLFHESIDEATNLFSLLMEKKYPVLLEHSELPDLIRKQNIDLFRKGSCKILVSVKSLIEGFNVPAVDVGIIVASSSAVRQRIQSMGRVMRPYKGKSGKDKTSLIYVLYAKNTVDEEIYAKYDWEKFTGINSNLFFDWEIGKIPIQKDGPPKPPPLYDIDIDESELSPGVEYPGKYEGLEYTCDKERNVKDKFGNYIIDLKDIANDIIKYKGYPGKFKITPKKYFVITRKKINDDWITIYIKRLDKLPSQSLNGKSDVSYDESSIQKWLSDAKPGDEYPFPEIPLCKSNLFFRLKKGGIIVKKVKDGEVYARLANRALCKEKGLEAEDLVNKIKYLRNKGENISQLDINELNHVLYVKFNKYYFIMALKFGIEFPD